MTSALQVDDVRQSIESRLDTLRTLRAKNFIDANEETLAKLNIVPKATGFKLKLKSNVKERAEGIKQIENDGFWSSQKLNDHIKANGERCASEDPYNCIQPFLIRAGQIISHVSAPRTMVMDIQKSTYAAIVAKDVNAATRYLMNNAALKLYAQGYFLAVGASGDNLNSHIPQALCQLYLVAENAGKDHIRGAVTNGYKWIFFILTFNKDRNGAYYRQSEAVYCRPSDSTPTSKDWTPEDPWPDVISGILAYWIEESFYEINEGDWFEEVNDE